MNYGALKLSDFLIDELILESGQTVREFVMERGSHIRTVAVLNRELESAGIRRLSQEELVKARKMRLIDANVLESLLSAEESKKGNICAFPVSAEAMERTLQVVRSAPTAYDQERVLRKIEGLYPEGFGASEKLLRSVLDRCMEIVRNGGY